MGSLPVGSPLYCCNSCGHLPDYGENRAYFMTSCGHVLCENCCRAGGLTCVRCQLKCRYAEISNTGAMKPEIRIYFSNPMDILKDAVARVVKVTQFQSSQAELYRSQMSQIVKRNKTLEDRVESLANENVTLKDKLDTLQQREQSWMGTTAIPRSNEDAGGFFNIAPIPEPSPFFGPPLNTNRTQNRTTFGSSSHGDNASNFGQERLTRRHTPTLQDIQSFPHGNPSTHRNSSVNRLFPPPPTFNSGVSGFRHHSNPNSNAATMSSRHAFNHPVVTVSRNNSDTYHTTTNLLSRLRNNL